MSLDAAALKVAVAAMALTDVWQDDVDPELARVHKPDLEALAEAVEPFRHSLLNPLHVRSECEICPPGGSGRSQGEPNA